MVYEVLMGTHSSSNSGNAAAIHQVSWFGVDENLEERPIYRSWFAEGHTPVFDINCFFFLLNYPSVIMNSSLNSINYWLT